MKKQKKAMQKLSPKKYILQKGRMLEFYECIINSDWEEKGMAVVTVCKKMPSGKLIFASYMLDLYCLGVKDSTVDFNIDEEEYRSLLEKFYPDGYQKYNPDFVHNLIYGALDFAEELGFKPHSDFKLTEYLLNPDLINNGIDDIEFGKNGKPLYVSGPFDNPEQIIGILKRNVGEGNYDYIMGG